MKKKIGIIGKTGRMGSLLVNEIEKSSHFANGLGFSLETEKEIPLENVFSDNDYIIDFSNAGLLPKTLSIALENPKPILICTTGFEEKDLPDLQKLVTKTIVLIASNTSISAFLQRYLVKKVAEVLGSEYSIDIIEKHHINKVDIPSGTAATLISDIKNIKENRFKQIYEAEILTAGKRKPNTIAINVHRTGNIVGEHEVIFNSEEDMISINHIVHNRNVFAKGALKIIEFLEKSKLKNGLYSMKDILKI